MSFKLSPRIEEILKTGEDFVGISKDDALLLMHLDLHSKAVYALMATANRMSRLQFANKGEKHLHIGLNVEPCPKNCRFCSLTRKAGVFHEKYEFSEEAIVNWARQGEALGTDGINLMTTGTYAFQRLLEIGRLLSGAVSVPLVANTRDISHKEGEALLDAGFKGFYHAVRLGEGIDTPFSVQRRIQTIQVLRDVGLLWMNCVEPVGPEHRPEEIVDLMILARRYGAAYSGVMRRINFPGSPMQKHGMISELEMARMISVSRLVMGDIPRAHCTHEPNSVALMAGANLFFPEVGSNPRDGCPDTGKGRGRTMEACVAMLTEMDWDPDRPSNCFAPGLPSCSEPP
ncbi:radical SAM protein [Desulfosarcina ovata subsp. sediminis]|uniref:Radical SAM protein n=1 Tax=Desulfosarcina ovata subsp. sediminis TaxID=885957 RepID=A0A5K7ZJB3_9BACT|nr:radical SAM protein [Desulfosarcina ovata]BBO81086.1 radical SAM protein [Desulfosarcina ovata subsp. sediminis]